MSLPRLVARLRLLLTDHLELEERRALLERPWEEEFLHWSREGHAWVLHGHLVPPPGRRRRSVTGQGWCPGARTTGTRAGS